jgi:hypothetical protein
VGTSAGVFNTEHPVTFWVASSRPLPALVVCADEHLADEPVNDRDIYASIEKLFA